MNIYFYIILVTIIIGFLIDIISDILNLKNLSEELPSEFKDVFSEELYRKSQEYTKTNTKFGFISSSFSLIIMLIFWFSGGFNWLDLIIRNWYENQIIIGVIYIGVLLLVNSILSIPFSIYSTFVIEDKYGFNKTTAKTFILDLIKSFALSIVIGLPVLAGILYIFQSMGELAWLYGWGAVIFFSLLVQYIAPVFIMPLFNKFTPLEDGELRTAIVNYAKSVKFSLSNVFVIDGSKRSSKSNAFFTGFGKNKRIALFDTLIEKHSVKELVAVLAHEIGHYKKKHIIQTMTIGIIHTGIIFYLLSIFLHEQELFNAFFMENVSIYTGLIFFGMLYGSIEIILSIFMNIFSRKNEYQADAFAVETTENTSDFINALKKLSAQNLSNLTPHPFNVFINYSHPPILQRIEAIRNQNKNT